MVRSASPHSRSAGATVFALALLYFGLLAPYGLNVGEEGGAVYLMYRTLIGQRPYIDFFSGYAPAYFYWHALILHLSGVNLLGIRVCLALVNSLSVWLLYTVARSVLPVRFAVLPAMAYLALLPVVPAISCSFNVPYPSWYTLLLWLLGFHALRRWSGGRGAGWLLLAGLLAGISCSFKPNTGVFNLAADALCVVMTCPVATSRQTRGASRLAWLLVAGVVGGVMVVFRAHLWHREGWIFVAPLLALIAVWARRGPTVEVSSTALPHPSSPEAGGQGARGAGEQGSWGAARRGPDLVLALSALLSGFAVITAPWLLYYLWQLGWAGFAHNVLLINAGYEQFFYLPYRALGWGDVAMTGGIAAVVVGGYACRRHWLPFPLLATLLAAAAAAVAGWALFAAPMPEGFQRAVQARVQDVSFGAALLVHWAVIAALWVGGSRWMRARVGRDLLFVLVSALFMFLSVYPRSDFFHLSFSVPLTLVLGAWLLERVERLWGRAVPAGLAPWVGRSVLAAVGTVLVVMAAPQLGLCRQVAVHYLRHAEGELTRLRLRRAPLLVRNDAAGQAALNLEPVVKYLERERRPGDRLFTFPNLDLICFLADLQTPARIGYFNPGLPDHVGEAEVVDTLTTHLPRFAVVSNPAPLFFAAAPAYYFILRDFIGSQYRVKGRAGSYVVLAHVGGETGSFLAPASADGRAPAPGGACAAARAALAPEPLRACLTQADRATVAALIQLIRDNESADAAAVLAELWAQRALAAQSIADDLLILRAIGEVGDARAGVALLAAVPRVDNQRQDPLATALFNIAVRGMIDPFQFGQEDAPVSTTVNWSAYDAQLRRWVRSPDEDIRRRFFAAWVLGQQVSAETAAAAAGDAATLLADPNPGLQLAAASALAALPASGDTGEHLLDVLTLQPSFGPSLLLQWSRRHPDVAGPLLSRVLTGGVPPAQREVVAFIAGVLRWPALVPSLQQAATAPQPRVRLASVWALGRMGDAAAVTVRAALSDADTEVRRVATAAADRMERLP